MLWVQSIYWKVNCGKIIVMDDLLWEVEKFAIENNIDFYPKEIRHVKEVRNYPDRRVIVWRDIWHDDSSIWGDAYFTLPK